MVQAERERTSLQAYERKVSVVDEERTILERQLFQSLAVAIKLEKMVMGLQVAYTHDTDQLYEKAKSRGLDQRHWGLFLRDEFDGEPPQPSMQPPKATSPQKRANTMRRAPLNEQEQPANKRSRRQDAQQQPQHYSRLTAETASINRL